MNSLIRRSSKSPRFWQFALTCYWLALFIGTHIPIDRFPLHQGSVDKFAHLAAFAGLAGIFAITWRLTVDRLTITHAVWIWLVLVVYGVLEEMSQPLVGRIASGWDWVADASGAALGLAVFSLLPDRWFSNAAPASEHPPGAPRGPWYRFSLKTAFMLMTLAAVLCYWMVLPSIYAQQFVRTLHKREYAKAESLFVSWSDKFPGDFRKSDDFKADPKIKSLTWRELWKGERRIFVRLSYGDENGKPFYGDATIIAYRRGLALHPLVFHVPFYRS